MYVILTKSYLLHGTSNNVKVTQELLTHDIRTTAGISTDAARDLLIATITVKYTQSNSVCYAVDGQVVGVGAGQQSRVDCVKLAGRKVDTWRARTHPKVLALNFKPGVKVICDADALHDSPFFPGEIRAHTKKSLYSVFT